jgi:hypothetical protein
MEVNLQIHYLDGVTTSTSIEHLIIIYIDIVANYNPKVSFYDHIHLGKHRRMSKKFTVR